MMWRCSILDIACFVLVAFFTSASSVFRRNAQPHITDMRTGGAWGYIPNKQVASVVTQGIACLLCLNGKIEYSKRNILAHA